MFYRTIRFIALIMLSAYLSACVTVPQSLRVDEGTELVTYQNALSAAQQSVGKQARWGGVIASIEHLSDQTRLEIVHFDLKSSSRPRVSDDSKGRFRLYVKAFLDPTIYKKGLSVTAVGNIAQAEQGKIDKFNITYPVLHSDAVYIWKKEVQVKPYMHRDPYWPYRPRYFHSPWSYYDNHSHRRTHNHRKPSSKPRSTAPSSKTPRPTAIIPTIRNAKP